MASSTLKKLRMLEEWAILIGSKRKVISPMKDSISIPIGRNLVTWISLCVLNLCVLVINNFFVLVMGR
jgi:hypothetical protein